ncbi:MAG: hypothetical protein Q4B43_10530 [Bacteroidota bacterium]|nr:hypothetical protein [Bacteroidota bacterium]
MNIELYINGTLADLPQRPFAYVLQANNMFDFNTREFSYSDVLYLPTTPTNREIFDFADEPATSNAGAYKRYQVDYYVNGIPIVQKANGFLMGKRGEVYIFDFKSNSRDIYVSLAGKQIKDLPLHELKHDKDLKTIKKTHNGTYPDYVYAVADYGGEVVKNINNRNYINFDYIPPSIKMDWILQKIKELKDPANPYIFESPFFDSPFWKSLYMTTSQGKVHNILGEQVYGIKDDGKQGIVRDTCLIENNENPPRTRGILKLTAITAVEHAGHYVITLEGEITHSTHNGGICVAVKKNHTSYEFLDISVTKNRKKQQKVVYLHQGQSVYLLSKYKDIDSPFNSDYQGETNVYTDFEKIRFHIHKYVGVDFNSLFSNFSLLDWFKEVTRMFSLTPMKDDNLKNVQQFYTLSERVNQAPVIDWSDRFIKITEQKYHDLSAYAQVNKFKFSKYDEKMDDQDGNDYNMRFNDQALTIEKEFKSKFFGGIVEGSDIPNLGKLDIFKFFDKELKEKEITENGQKKKIIETIYKDKNNCYHLFQLGSNLTAQGLCVNEGNEKEDVNNFQLSLAKFEPLRWENLINNYYQDLPRLMENLYFLTCEFALLETDIYNFSFYSRIYVDKLGSYFLPNKIIFRTDAPAIVEMIKIRNI